MNKYRVLLMHYTNADTNGKVLDEYTVDADSYTNAYAQAVARSPESEVGDCLFVTWDKDNVVVQ